MKRQTGIRLTETAHEWLADQSVKRGISKNDVVQELINVAMEKDILINTDTQPKTEPA